MPAVSIRIDPVDPEADRDYVRNTGNHYTASCDIHGSPAYDGAGPTVELALVALARQMGEALRDVHDARELENLDGR